MIVSSTSHTELPGMNLPRLRNFLIEHGVSFRGDLQVKLIHGGRSNLTFKAWDDRAQWVVRRPPMSGLTPSAHDMFREWTVTSALQDTAVPVPRVVAFADNTSVLGAPFTVVEYVEGLVIRDHDDLDALSDAEIAHNTATLVRVLVDLHSVDYVDAGLSAFGRPEGFVERQVKLWAAQWQRVKTRDLPDVDRLHAALLNAMPQRSRSSIVHGDYRVDNVIVDAGDVGKVLAVVDWEMSTLGDPLTDVALMSVYRQPVFDALLGMKAAWTSARYPTAEALAHMYATQSGRDLAHWNFYLALANFKLGVIGEGITYRAVSGSNTGHGAISAAEATHEFMAAGLHALQQADY
jgi:aminoglycoside phosphotransferase (APT) family kinase protein